jgi:hypothetical protein
MLPSQGRCLAVFLLSRAATLKPRSTIEEWINAAQSASSIVAASLNLKQPAEILLLSDLAHHREQVIVSQDLANLCTVADRATLTGIARVLLLRFPPPWLRIAVRDGSVSYDYVPAADLDELQWLDADLTDILIDVYRKIEDVRNDQIRKWFGETAELIVVAALKLAGRSPVHVSRISDVFGYDIECQSPHERIEVKAASENTKGRFHLSRNEFEKSKLHGPQWKLLQVVFRTETLVLPTIRSTEVMELLELPSVAIGQVIPPDTPSFKWGESAEVSPPSQSWLISNLHLDETFVSPGRPPLQPAN